MPQKNTATLFIQSISLNSVGIDTLITPLGQVVSELLTFHLVNIGVLAARPFGKRPYVEFARVLIFPPSGILKTYIYVTQISIQTFCS